VTSKGKFRVIWKPERTGGRWTRTRGPAYWNGGTCLYEGVVLVYSEVPDELKVEGQWVLYYHPYRDEDLFFCPISDVEAILDRQGAWIYPQARSPANV